ncbi:MAG TPA: ABC transporter permease, partial [Gaiellaceae bacterium]
DAVAPPAGSGPTITYVRPRKLAPFPDLAEIWHYRELLYFLTWRDVKVRYKQTVLGAAWSVIQPFTMMIVFTIFLSKLAHVPSSGVPYPISTYSALVPWTLFAASLAGASDSLVRNTPLVSKVYFPRLLLPVSSAGSFVIDFLIASTLLGAMMVWYSITPSWQALWIPFLSLLALMTALGVGIWFSALNAKYRDIRYLVPFLVQLWLFASPVAYPITLVPHHLRTLYGLNPMAGVVQGFRSSLLHAGPMPVHMILVSVATSVALLLGGLTYFHIAERKLADII